MKEKPNLGAAEVQRMLGVNYRTAGRMLDQLRSVIAEQSGRDQMQLLLLPML
jgi:hypothetical protein